MAHTHVTAPTRFVEANGIRCAYRRFGKDAGLSQLFITALPGRSVRRAVGIASASRPDEITTSEQQRINPSSGLIIPPRAGKPGKTARAGRTEKPSHLVMRCSCLRTPIQWALKEDMHWTTSSNARRRFRALQDNGPETI